MIFDVTQSTGQIGSTLCIYIISTCQIAGLIHFSNPLS